MTIYTYTEIEVILSKGTDTWNKWRKENPQVALNLRNAYLRGRDLREVNLSGANLLGADLNEVNFSKANLGKAKFGWASLCKADLSGANLGKAKLYQAVLREADLSDADLSGADLREANFSYANLSRALLRGADLRGANLSYTKLNDIDLMETTGLTKEQIESAYDSTGIKVDMDDFLPRFAQEVPRIFLSYTWADKAAVEAVDQWLRDKNARVILDDRNFAAGEVLHDEIIRWIEEAGFVVCFVSQHSKDRPYPKLERDIAERLRAKGNAKVIYFNLDDTTLDVAHETRIYIPGHKMEFEEACEKLWQGILKTVQPPKAIDLEPVKRAGKEWTKKLSSIPPAD